jgi:hypothetical protein
MYEMNSQVLAAPLVVTSRRRPLWVVLLAAVAGAAIAAGLLIGMGGDAPAKPKGATELRGPGFALAYPARWKPVPAAQAAGVPGHPAAIVRRSDGKGIVIVRRKSAPADQTLRKMTRDLSAGLERRFTDFRFVSARVTQVRGGTAFLYTFVRTRQKTAQSIALVKVGKNNFTLDAVAASGDPRAAREVAAIVRSFGP